jgi:hypothetical protein
MAKEQKPVSSELAQILKDLENAVAFLEDARAHALTAEGLVGMAYKSINSHMKMQNPKRKPKAK